MKGIKEMTEQEILEAYEVGKKWVSNRVQVVGTNKNVLGEVYDNEAFLAGLKRLELLESEMQERGTIYV